ncbi:DNA primase [Buchnera aphidicola]|uniref:DNA primase n=1 Tax=Buchnera aphidicola (Sarucallis kahawaluokalani) TaxID=1241878 RepID=A0A4D6YJ16_9GAMM|nr:DNA primase [Buchnera aphidicola]QCI25850.1 DNA primase [Buchnera aphidicola (Sarucallis kahawaluokalani)]
MNTNQFIPPNLIKEILDKTNIVDIITERIQIKKIGNNYYGLCPFHQENTPSFTVNHEKQYFYCFGCNINGNIIDFLMQYHQFNFIESIHELANITGTDIPKLYSEKIIKKYYKKNELYQTNQIAEKLYFKNIKLQHSKIAQIYLKNRKINIHMINYFNIGFSHNQFFLSKNIKNKKYINNLIYLGVIYKKNNINQYDRLYHKIIFPIKNKYGKITGFGGRSLNSNHPKYINSPKNIIFNKSDQIYGIEKINIQKNNTYILIVEGYFDVISLTQFNIKNVVAILGTNITKYQINILFKITNHIIFCYDGDEAGKQASWRTIQMILSYVNNIRNIQFIFLPDGEDPNSIIYKDGTEKFKHRIKNAKNIINCFLEKITQKNNISSIYKISHMLEKNLPLITNIPDTYIQTYVKKEIGKKIGILDEYQLYNIFNQKKKIYIKKNFKINNMRILISLIIQNPQLSNIIPFKINELKKMNISGISLFLEIFTMCKKYNNINTGQILEFYRKDTRCKIIKKLAYWNNLIDYKNINHVFLDIIQKIYNIALQRKYKKLIIQDRLKNLHHLEQKILWNINKTLLKIT